MHGEAQLNPQSSISISEYKNVLCRFCKSTNTLKKGFRATENRGKIQRFYCRDCKKRFVVDDGFYRMRNNPQKITQSIDLFYKGISTRKVQEHLGVFYIHNSSNVSIYNWITKYSEMVGQYVDKINTTSSKQIQVDEMEFFTKGKPTWFIDSIDPESRYMIASGFFKNRGIEEIKEVLKLAKSKDNKISHVTTDGFTAYKKVVKKVFYTYKNKVNHKVTNASKGEGFNHKIERLHNTIRERTKIMRGFHGSVESARAIMKGVEIQYNFNRKHLAIDCHPYQLATELQLGKNKWLDLIKLSKSR
ncbi:IS1/IS6 family transposase [Candidatus Woesearchaeota archaeon]|nr:IS1/IS6 family transposase [Candidatus Woesearchaeota archaeon]